MNDVQGVAGLGSPRPCLRDRIERSIESLAACLAAEYRLVVVLLVIAYFAITWRYATRAFWYDELFTVYLCRLPSVARIWDALKAGADFNPPLLYIVTRPFSRMLGEYPVPLRIPQMFGFLTMCVCLARVVSRRCGKLYGLAAAVLPLLTLAYYYATEARPYGLVLGFAGLSLLWWQRLVEQPGRRWPMAILFGLSLAGAIQSHAYALLLLLPFGCAELVRTAQRKRIDILVWVPVLVAAASAAIYLPLSGNAAGYAALPGYTLAPQLSSIPASYAVIFGDSMGAILVVLAVVIALGRAGLRSGQDQRATPTGTPVPAYELVCLAVFLLVPIAAVSLATFLHGGYLPRYGLLAVIGGGALFPVFLHRRTGGDRVTAAVMICVFCGSWILTKFVIETIRAFRAPVARSQPISRPGPPMAHLQPIRLADLDDSWPIVISNGVSFLETDYREPASVAKRLVFLTDADTAVAFTGTNQFDHGFYRLRQWFPIRGAIIDYHQFLAKHDRFWVYGPFEYFEDWAIQKLLQDGVRLTLKGRYTWRWGDAVLLEAETEPSSSRGDAVH